MSDVRGNPVAELSLAPPLFVSRAMTLMRRSTTTTASPREALPEAGRIFLEEKVADLDPDAYARLVRGVRGLPMTAVRIAVNRLGPACDEAFDADDSARPVAPCGRAPLTSKPKAAPPGCGAARSKNL